MVISSLGVRGGAGIAMRSDHRPARVFCASRALGLREPAHPRLTIRDLRATPGPPGRRRRCSLGGHVASCVPGKVACTFLDLPSAATHWCNSPAWSVHLAGRAMHPAQPRARPDRARRFCASGRHEACIARGWLRPECGYLLYRTLCRSVGLSVSAIPPKAPRGARFRLCVAAGMLPAASRWPSTAAPTPPPPS